MVVQSTLADDETVSQKNMGSKITEQQTASFLFNDFCQNATIHGLKNIVHSQLSPWRRLIWMGAFGAAVGGFIYVFVAQFIEFTALPTLIQQSLEIHPSLRFPAVTLCNLNKVPKSLIENNEAARQFLLATSVLGANSSHRNDTLRFNASMLREAVSLSMNSTFKSCRWKNIVYKCEDLFVIKMTDFGLCFTFNGNNGSHSEGKLTVQAGSRFGLTVIMRVHQDDYTLSYDSDAAGVRVLLHDHNETPLVDGRGFDVAPGTATKGSLSLTRVTNLPPPYSTLSGAQCVDTSIATFTNKLELFDSYDPKACVYECRYKYINMVCKCRALVDPGNETLCDSQQILRCYNPRYGEFMNNNMKVNCDCPVPCEWSVYKAEMSMAAYPSIAMMSESKSIFNLSLTNEQIRQDFLKLTLAYDDLYLLSITQVPLHSVRSIISTIGGMMGIFLGASVFSLLEIMQFTFDIVFLKLRCMVQRTHTTKVNRIL